MPPATLTLSGRKFVVLPEREYRQLKAKATRSGGGKHAHAKPRRVSRQDRGDVAESQRRLSEPGRTPADQVFRKLGI
jgi:hypothetical protein